MFTKKTKLCLLIGSFLGLTACQSLPNPQSQHTNTKTLTAHELMKHTMLHRFDKSYDFEKNTHYKSDILYQKNDIESQDVSVFLTLIQAFNSRYQNNDSEYDPRPERQTCETDFRKSYNQAIKPFLNDENTDLSQINDNLQKAIENYDSCMQNLPELPKSVVDENDEKTNDEALKQCESEFNKNMEAENPKTIDLYIECLHKASNLTTTEPTEQTDDSLQYAKNFETFRDNSTISVEAKAETENSDYTTINSIIDKQPSMYQMGLTKAIEKLKEIDKNNKKVLPMDDSDAIMGGKIDRQDIGKMLVNMRLTPEQIELINKVYLEPQQISYRGTYDKAKGQFSIVAEEQHETTYSQAYKRIPMLIDMNELSVVFEPDVALPFVSLIFDKKIPDLAGKSVKFTLPENLRQNIPLALLKDSVFRALGQAYGDLNPEKFSEILPDDYAKSIHASRVIKIHLSTHDIGFILGRGLKYFVKDVEEIAKNNPQYIENNENFKLSLEFLQSLNKVYRADDLAKLSQLFETIVPLSYNSFNYYYFDNQQNLIAYRKINDYQSSLFNAKAQSITTNQFNYQTLGNHRYYQPTADDIIDGNALLKQYNDNKQRLNEAKDARFAYAVEAEAVPDAVIDAQKATQDK